MSCASIQSVQIGCFAGNVGGIKSIAVVDWSAGTAGSAYTYTVNIESTKEGSSMSESFTSDIATGAASAEITVTVIVPRRDSTKVNAIKILATGQRNLVLKCTDNNGEVFYVGTSYGSPNLAPVFESILVN